jgi:uncharacterized protein YqfA (UPF0365 family)
LLIAIVNPPLIACAVGIILVLGVLPLLMTFRLSRKFDVPFANVLGMRLRRIPPITILVAFATARDNELDLNLDHLETHFLAGGRVGRIVEAMVLAKTKGWAVDYQRLAVLDLVGEDPVLRYKNAQSPDDLALKAQ